MSGDGGNPGLAANEGVVKAVLEEHVDETDYRIIKALSEDGRMSDTDLGERVGLSRTAVRRRRKNLQDEGILEIMAVIVLQEADLAYADVRVTLDPHISLAERAAFIERLIEDGLVYCVDSCLGDYDLFVRVWNEDLDAVKNYLWELLAGDECVESYETTPVVKTWKAWDRTLDLPDVVRE